MMPRFPFELPTEQVLLLDLGHSRLKCLRGGPALAWSLQAFAYTPDTLLEVLPELGSHFQYSAELNRIAVASVCASLESTLFAWLRSQWPMAQIVNVRAEAAWGGVRTAYALQEAAHLGVDRWLGLIAASRLCPGQTCLILGAGTSLTLDLLRKDGQHLGGWILPGLNALYNQLTLRASLPEISGLGLPFLGTSTHSSVLNGVSFFWQEGVLALLKHLRSQQDLKDLIEEGIPLVITGGESIYLPLEEMSKEGFRVREESLLLFQGLWQKTVANSEYLQ